MKKALTSFLSKITVAWYGTHYLVSMYHTGMAHPFVSGSLALGLTGLVWSRWPAKTCCAS